MSTTTNPYIERGVVLTEKEWEHVQAGLEGQANYYHAQGLKHDYAETMDLMKRLHDVVHAGTGLTEEIMKRYQLPLHRAIQRQDANAFRRAYVDMMATAIRLEPDPAKTCAKLLIQSLQAVQIAQALQVAADPLLGRVQSEIAGCRSDMAAGQWDPNHDVLEYLTSWIEAGLSNARMGLEPWPQPEVVIPDELATGDAPLLDPTIETKDHDAVP
jgi:hypothetical protein